MRRFGLYAAFFALMLGGCGGGGGSSTASSMPTPASFPVASPLRAFEASTLNYTLSGTLSGQALTLQFGVMPGLSSNFEETAASTSTTTLIAKENGILAAQNSITDYLNPNTGAHLGTINNTNGQYLVVTSYTGYPATAQIGQSGTVENSVLYFDSTKQAVVANVSDTWQLEADPNSSSDALLCVNTIEAYTSGSSGPDGGSECVHLTTSGNVSAPILTLIVKGQPVTFR